MPKTFQDKKSSIEPFKVYTNNKLGGFHTKKRSESKVSKQI